MMAMAKALSSGYLPISALMISDPIYQAMVEESEKIGVFGHGFTYGGHPVSCAVAQETLKIYDEIQISSHVERVVPHFQAALRRAGEHPLIGEAPGTGLARRLGDRQRTRRPASRSMPRTWSRHSPRAAPRTAV